MAIALADSEEYGGHIDGPQVPTFVLNFKVAAIQDLQLRAYLRQDNTPEWLWARVHKRLEIVKEVHRFLRGNDASLKLFFNEVQVDPDELRYNPKRELQKQRLWKDHTVESRALLAMCLWTVRSRPMKSKQKRAALVLFLNLLDMGLKEAALQTADVVHVSGMVVNQDGVLSAVNLKITASELVQGWGELLAHCPGAATLWERLSGHCWHGRCITSTKDIPLLADIGFFLCFLCHACF